MSARFEGIRIGVAMCGSFCTFKKVFNTVKLLREQGADIIPIMSFNAASLSTRFGRAEENLALFEELAGKRAIITIEGAEPIGPKDMTDVMNLRHYYFAPLKQDDFAKKPTSVVGDFDLIPDTLEKAIMGKQVQPVLM